MSDNLNVFESAPAPDNKTDSQPSSPVDKSEIEVIKKRLDDKDAFIEQLKQELSEYRAELKTRVSIQDLVEQAKNAVQNGAELKKTETEVTQQPKLSMPDLEKMVSEALNKQTTKATKQKNVDTVRQELKKAYGDSFVDKVKAKIEKLDIGPEFFNEIAANSPKTALEIIGIGEVQNIQSPDLQAPPKSMVNTTSSFDSVQGNRTKSHYDQLKKENPRRYWSVAVQAQMHRDALTLKDAFYK